MKDAKLKEQSVTLSKSSSKEKNSKEYNTVRGGSKETKPSAQSFSSSSGGSEPDTSSFSDQMDAKDNVFRPMPLRNLMQDEWAGKHVTRDDSALASRKEPLSFGKTRTEDTGKMRRVLKNIPFEASSKVLHCEDEDPLAGEDVARLNKLKRIMGVSNLQFGAEVAKKNAKTTNEN